MLAIVILFQGPVRRGPAPRGRPRLHPRDRRPAPRPAAGQRRGPGEDNARDHPGPARRPRHLPPGHPHPGRPPGPAHPLGRAAHPRPAGRPHVRQPRALPRHRHGPPADHGPVRRPDHPADVARLPLFPWSALHVIPWVQGLALADPLTYASEGLRAAVTSQPHLSLLAVYPVLAAATGLLPGRQPATSPAASSADEFHGTCHRRHREYRTRYRQALETRSTSHGAPFRARILPSSRTGSGTEGMPGCGFRRTPRASAAFSAMTRCHATPPRLPILPGPARSLIVKPDVSVLRYPDYCSCSAQVRSRVLI